MGYALTRLERVYAALEDPAAYGTIPAGFPSNIQCIRFARFTGMNDVQTIFRPDKTGSRSQTPGTAGRKFARWSMEMGMAASGTAGTAPHVTPILQAVFGKAPQVNPSSVVFGLDDAIPSLSLASFRKRAGGYGTGGYGTDRIMHGGVVNSATYLLGQDAATWSVEGTAQWILESDQWAVASTEEKGGLVGFPSEPGSPDATDGGLCIGFTGSWVTPDGTMGNIRNAQLRIVTGNEVIRDTFGSFYPNDVQGGERYVSVQFSCYEKDDVATSKLREYGNGKAPIDLTMTVGSVPGNIWSFALNSVQLASPSMNEPGLRYTMDFADSRAFATTLTSLDELVLTLT